MRSSTTCSLLGLCLALLGGCAALPSDSRGPSPSASSRMPAQSVSEPAEAPGSPAGADPAEWPVAGRERDVGSARRQRGPQATTIRGSGRLIGALGTGAAREAPAAAEDGVLLNFEDAALAEVIRTILGELLGEPYSIHPEVTGTVSFAASEPLPSRALIPLLEELLAANGAALIEGEAGYRVVPRGIAAEASTPIETGASGTLRGYRTRVVPLEYASAAHMEPLLREAAPFAGQIRADPARNALLLRGSGPELRYLGQLIELFDVDWLSGMSFALIPIRHGDANSVVEELRSVFGGGELAVPVDGLLRFSVIERLNAVLAIAARPGLIDQAQRWAARLDQPAGGPGRRLYVYRVENGRAGDLAEVLNGLFGTDTGRRARREDEESGVAPGLEPVRISNATGDRGRELTEERGAARAEEETPAASASLLGGARVIAEPSRNALVILATPSEYAKIEGALAQLDLYPLQVLVEASIVEVSLSGELTYGVQWFFENRLPDGLSGEARIGGDLDFSDTFSYTVTNAADEVRGLLRALASEGRIEVLSAPSLMVLDNRTAEIRVGDQQPVETSIIAGDGVVATSVEFKDTGVILEVTPRVNSGGLVTLEIVQEVTDVGPADEATGQRTFLQRSIDSSVAVQSGETIVLGGLIRENETRTGSGVPGLRRLPVLGALFGRTSERTSRTELLVLLTPRVVGNANESRRVTNEFREQLGALRAESPERKGGAEAP